MKKSDLFAMAWQNLRNRRTRTRLTIAGVVVGTCAIIIMVSIGVGIDKMITSQYQSDSTLNKITVYPMGDYTNDSGEVQKEMPFDDKAVNYFSKLNNVKTVVPTLEISSYINISHGKYTYNSSVYGIPLKEMEMLGYKTDQGGFDKYRDKNAALFGNQIIQFFSDSQGNNPKYKYDENYNISESEFDFMKDTFTFCAKNQNSDSEGGNYSLTQENGNDESSTGSSSQPSNGGTQRFNVIGTLKKASNDSEAATAIYIDLDLAKQIVNESIRLSNIRNYKLTYSSINVYCNDSKDVAAVKKEIQDKGYSCSTDDEGLQEQKKVMRVVQLILGAIGAVSMFVAAFGISNTMVMSVFERTKEIGIMKVLGCDIKDIKDMFLYEAGIIGLFGGTIGIIISYIISIIANLVAKKVMSGMIDTSMGAKICVSSIPLWLALLGIAFSVGVGVLAGLSPAITWEKTVAAMQKVIEADDFSDAMELTDDMTAAATAQGGTLAAVYQAQSGGQPVGYAINVEASGSQGTISMMVGIDMDGAVTGVSIVTNSETSGIGSKVMSNEPLTNGTRVLDQFIGKSAADGVLSVGSNVDAITGATVSTKGVTTGVNAALAAAGVIG